MFCMHIIHKYNFTGNMQTPQTYLLKVVLLFTKQYLLMIYFNEVSSYSSTTFTQPKKVYFEMHKKYKGNMYTLIILHIFQEHKYVYNSVNYKQKLKFHKICCKH